MDFQAPSRSQRFQKGITYTIYRNFVVIGNIGIWVINSNENLIYFH